MGAYQLQPKIQTAAQLTGVIRARLPTTAVQLIGARNGSRQCGQSLGLRKAEFPGRLIQVTIDTIAQMMGSVSATVDERAIVYGITYRDRQ